MEYNVFILVSPKIKNSNGVLRTKKVVPVNISEIITSVSLAYWLMDDGSWCGNGIHFNSNNFSEQEVLKLITILKTKFNLKASLHSRNRIYIQATSVDNLINLVRPYIHFSMMYKINKTIKPNKI